MKTIESVVVFLMLCVVHVAMANAGDPVANGSLAGMLIPRDAFVPRQLAPVGEVEDVLLALDYDKGERALVYASDFNGDGEHDLLIASSDRLCGTAGCAYSLLDGSTMREVGHFFGHVAILDARISGFPVVQVMSRRDLSAINLSTYVFDGRRYREIAYALLSEAGVQEWRQRMASSPQRAMPR